MFVNFNKTFHPSEEDIRKENEFIDKEVKRMHDKYGDCRIFCKRYMGNVYNDFKQCTFDLDINSDNYDLHHYVCDNFKMSDFYEEHLMSNTTEEKQNENKEKAFLFNKETGEVLFSISVPNSDENIKEKMTNLEPNKFSYKDAIDVVLDIYEFMEDDVNDALDRPKGKPIHPQKEAIEIAVESIGKQIPAKPIYGDFDDDGSDEENIIPYSAECPVCGYEFEFGTWNYEESHHCVCGQAIDWSE